MLGYCLESVIFKKFWKFCEEIFNILGEYDLFWLFFDFLSDVFMFVGFWNRWDGWGGWK